MEDREFYQLRDAIPADPFLPGPQLDWWVWALVALAATGMAAVIFAVLRRPGTRPGIDLAAARRRALEALAAIDPSGRGAAVATGLSLLLRRFLADTLGDPALFETHEEFLSRRASLDGLPGDQRRRTRGHFATLARVKYGPDTGADTAELLREARELLETLEPAPAEPSSKHRTPTQLPHPTA